MASTTFRYYKSASEQEVQEGVMTGVVNGTVPDSNFHSSVFTILKRQDSQNIYMVEQLTFSQEGTVDIVASEYRCDDDERSLLAQQVVRSDLFEVYPQRSDPDGFPYSVTAHQSHLFAGSYYPIKTFKSQSGQEVRILYGSERTETKLSLSYTNIGDASAELFLDHYDEVKGTFNTFTMPDNASCWLVVSILMP